MAKQDIGKVKARVFQMQHGEELESILAGAGINGLAMSAEDNMGAIFNAVLSLAANPLSKERFGRFVTSVWSSGLDDEIEDAEDNDDEQLAAELFQKKRRQYNRLPAKSRNEILQNLYEQQVFKDFLSGYLALLPGDMEAQIKNSLSGVLASMNTTLAGSKDTSDSDEKKSKA